MGISEFAIFFVRYLVNVSVPNFGHRGVGEVMMVGADFAVKWSEFELERGGIALNLPVQDHKYRHYMARKENLV